VGLYRSIAEWKLTILPNKFFSMMDLMVRKSPSQRLLWKMVRIPVEDSEILTNSCASSKDEVNGFSTMTFLPFSRAALANAKCDSGGVVMMTKSTSVANNSSGVLTIVT